MIICLIVNIWYKLGTAEARKHKTKPGNFLPTTNMDYPWELIDETIDELIEDGVFLWSYGAWNSYCSICLFWYKWGVQSQAYKCRVQKYHIMYFHSQQAINRAIYAAGINAGLAPAA